MTVEKILQTFKSFCRAGLMDGLEVEAWFCGRKFRMFNVHIDDNGDLRFDQDWYDGCWHDSQRNAYVRNQVQCYLEECLAKAKQFIHTDKNLF